MKSNFILTAFLFAAFGNNVNAQNTDSNALYLQLEEVEIKGVRAGQTAPFAKTTITKSEIKEKNNGQDIPYILSQTPSVIVNSDAGTGIGYTDLRIRGTDNQRTNFTINGIPVNDAESQGTFFVNFPDLLSSTHSIQIQRGVGSSTNGPGSFGASVNINNIEQEEEASATITNSFGSFNTIRNSIKAGTGLLKDHWNFDVRLSHIKSDGYMDRSFAKLKSLQFLAGWTSLNQKTNIKFNLFTGSEKTGQAWNGVPQDTLASNRKMNELGIKEDGTYYDDQTDNYQQDYYQLFFNHFFNQNWTLNAALFLTRGRGYYNEYKIGESYETYGLPDFNDSINATSLIRQLWLDNYNYGTTFSLHYFKDKLRNTIGGAYTMYEGKHYGMVKWAQQGIPSDHKWYDNIAHKNDFNIYNKTEYFFTPNILGYLDLQYRNVAYEIDGYRKTPEVNQKLNYNFFNPKLGFSYQKNNSKAFVSFAVANKEPNRDDLEANVDQIPKHESLYDAELGYEFNSSNLSYGANLYYMYYKNQLILTGKINDVGAYTRTNVPNSYRAGIELFGKGSIIPKLNWSANLTLSQNKIKDFTEYYDDYDNGGQIATIHSNTDIALSPNLLSFAGLDYNVLQHNNQEFTIGLNAHYVGKQYLDNTQNNNRSIDPYTLANLKLNYAIKHFIGKELFINLSVNNLFNKMYESKGYTYSYVYSGLQTFNYYFPQAGTNFLLTIGLEF